MIKKLLLLIVLPFIICASNDDGWMSFKGVILRNIVFSCCFYETNEFSKKILGQDFNGDGKPDIYWVIKGMKKDGTQYYKQINYPEKINV